MTKNKGHILVVDDDPLNRMQLVQVLMQLGYSSAQAEDGEQALQSLDEDNFDLMILDLVMPGLDGFNVLSRVKNNIVMRDVPVVVISALDEMDDIVKCIEMGAEDYLQKPFEPALLEARVGACLEKKRLRETVVRQLGKYVPESVADSIIHNQVSLAPRRATATVLFSDIENFTGLTETMPPERVLKMLNEYFSAIVDLVVQHHGVVNQFIGDAMLVTFNLPVDDPNHADNAIRTALAIQQVTAGNTFAGELLKTRIGVNTGEVIAGNVGTGSRHSYTVYGDAVNTAARLEKLNKNHGTNIIVSGSTVALLNEAFPLDAIGEVSVRGKQESVRIFKCRNV